MTAGGELGRFTPDCGEADERGEEAALQPLTARLRSHRDVAANLRMFGDGMFSTTSSTVRCTRRSANWPPLAARDDESSADLISFATFFDSPLAPPPTSTAGPCQPAPDSFRVITSTQSTSFHMLLKAAAVAHGDGPQTRQRLDHIAVENDPIEVNDRFDRDVSEDAAVVAYNAATDGERRELARQPAPGIRGVGFRTSLWSVVDLDQVADADVLGLTEELDTR